MTRARTIFVDKLAALANHFERAMVTFLDHNQFWKGATRFYHADTLPYWRKRKNLPHELAAVDDGSLRKLADLIRDYFHHTEGRGNNCVVGTFRRGELDYFFSYPEDYSQQRIEWVNGEFDRRPLTMRSGGDCHGEARQCEDGLSLGPTATADFKDEHSGEVNPSK